MAKFTFKTEKSTGRYRSFYPDHHHIKYNKVEIGFIDDKYPHKIRMRIMKDETHTDSSPSEWMWLRFKKEFETIQEAKDWLNEYYDAFITKYKFPTE